MARPVERDRGHVHFDLDPAMGNHSSARQWRSLGTRARHRRHDWCGRFTSGLVAATARPISCGLVGARPIPGDVCRTGARRAVVSLQVRAGRCLLRRGGVSPGRLSPGWARLVLFTNSRTVWPSTALRGVQFSVDPRHHDRPAGPVYPRRWYSDRRIHTRSCQRAGGSSRRRAVHRRDGAPILKSHGEATHRIQNSIDTPADGRIDRSFSSRPGPSIRKFVRSRTFTTSPNSVSRL